MTKRTIQIQFFFLLNVQNWIGNHKLDYKLLCVTLHQSLFWKNCKKRRFWRVLKILEIYIYRKRATATEPLKIDKKFKKQKCVEFNYEQLCRWTLAIRETCLEWFFRSMLEKSFFHLSQVWCLSSPPYYIFFSQNCEYLTGTFQDEYFGARFIFLSVLGAEIQNL